MLTAAVAAANAVEGALEVCWGSAAAGSASEATWAASDAVEALNCVLVTGSLF